jgi:hypothetical protein
MLLPHNSYYGTVSDVLRIQTYPWLVIFLIVALYLSTIGV